MHAEPLKNLGATYNSFYVYDETVIEAQIDRLLRCFADVTFLYSIKANPAKPIVSFLQTKGFGADAASLAEVFLAKECGVERDSIYYSAPGKTEADLLGAVDHCMLIADSLLEVERINRIASARNTVLDIGIRINPDFTFEGERGVPSKFGIDEAVILNQPELILKHTHVRITGIHVHVKSQELCAEKLKRYYENMFRLGLNITSALHTSLQYINMGSGLGIPAWGQPDLDVVTLGQEVCKLISQYRATLPNTKVIIETGRYAVGLSGYYATKVLDVKESMGKKFIILCNTLNGFMRPSMAQFLLNYTCEKNLGGCEPLFSGTDAHGFMALNDSVEQETVTLVGNLCTSADVIARDITLPKLEVGDLVVLTNAGCYAASLSPVLFASLEPPMQFYMDSNETIHTI